MSYKIGIIAVLIIGLGAGSGVVYSRLGQMESEKNISKLSATSTDNGLPQIVVQKPVVLRTDGGTESTYFGEILSDLDGQIFAFREGVVERVLVDLGSYVRQGQPVATISAGQFTPEYAGMLAEREEMVIRARAMVAAAEDNLARAKQLGSDNNQSTVEVVTQQQMIANVDNETQSMVALEKERVKLQARKIDSELRNTYATIRNVFYSSGVPTGGNSWKLANESIGTLNPQLIIDLNSRMSQLKKMVELLPAENYVDVSQIAITALDISMKLLDATVVSGDYSQEMMVDNRSDLIMARRELSEMLSDYNEQITMVDKTVIERHARISDAEQMLKRMQADAGKMLIIARAELTAAERSRSIVGAASGNRTVNAPFSGYITQRLVNVGQKISMDTPLFALIQDTRGKKSSLFVRFEVPESELNRFKVKDAVSLVRTQNPLQQVRATVERVGVGVNVVTRAIQIEARLDNPPADLLSHATVRVMHGMEMTKSVVIPRDAVISAPDGTLKVLVVRDAVVQSVTVQAGRIIADRVVITSGLTPADDVVLKPSETAEKKQVTAIVKEEIKIAPTDVLPDGHGGSH